LMGSILSFPILCLVNLVSVLAFDNRHKVVHQLSGPRLREYLMRILDIAINGDDLGTKDILERAITWVRGVRAVSGIVSRGKTLKSRRVLTINSALFIDGKQVPVIRASLMCALNDGIHKVPDAQWSEFFASELWSPDIDRIFASQNALFPDMPRSWGGLGLIPVTRESFNPVRALYLRQVKPKVEFAAIEEEETLPSGLITNGRAHLFERWACPEIQVHGVERRRVSGWVTRASAKELAKIRFGVNVNKFAWTDDRVSRPGVWEAWQEAIRQSLLLSERGKNNLYANYLEAFHQSSCGNTKVTRAVDNSCTLQLVKGSYVTLPPLPLVSRAPEWFSGPSHNIPPPPPGCHHPQDIFGCTCSHSQGRYANQRPPS
jgi:hypothetical protein